MPGQASKISALRDPHLPSGAAQDQELHMNHLDLHDLLHIALMHTAQHSCWNRRRMPSAKTSARHGSETRNAALHDLVHDQ